MAFELPEGVSIVWLGHATFEAFKSNLVTSGATTKVISRMPGQTLGG